MADFSPTFLIFAALTVLAAYTVFGATGFGAGVISVPLLAHWLPLSFIVPLICVFDVAASGITGARKWHEVDHKELLALLPWMLGGMAAGTWFLLKLPAMLMLGALGVFVFCYGCYNLFVKLGAVRWGRPWVVPFGLTGGVFSAAFGTGGPIYSVFLTGRIFDKSQLRSTIAVLVSISALLRITAFVVSGLLLQQGLLPLAAILAVPVLAGLWLGGKLHDRLPREGILRLISVLLVVNGVSLVLRAAA